MPTEVSEEYTKNVFDFAAIGMALLTMEGSYLKVNRYFCEFYGYEPHEFLTMNFRDITHPEDLSVGMEELRRTHLGEIASFHVEKRYIHKSGKMKWGLASISAVRDKWGKPLYQIAQIQDISERKAAEQSLSHRIEFERLVTTISTRFINLVVDTIDQEINSSLEKIGQFLEVDRIFIHQFYENGTKYKKVCEWNLPSIEPIPIVEKGVDIFPWWYSRLSKLENLYIADIDKLPDEAAAEKKMFKSISAKMIINLPLIQSDQLVGFIGIANDRLNQSYSEVDLRLLRVVGEVIFSALDRKRAESARISSEERFIKAFTASPTIMVISSLPDMRILDVNDIFLTTLGYTRDEIIDRRVNYFSGLDQKGLEDLHRCFRETGSIHNWDIKLRMKSGEEKLGLLSAERIRMENGTCVLMAIQDITEKRHMEREMARLDRLNLIGEMAAGIGHEIRNPMTTVRGYLQMLSSKIETDRYKETFQLMIEELDRANLIISEYLSLSQKRIVDFKMGNLNSIINLLYPLISAHATNEDKLVAIKLGDIPDFLLDEKELRQLILNLTRNGLEAMAASGVLTISTFLKRGRPVLMVEDQGCGIPNEIMDKIGTPFFTTKDNGTGLGMAICYSIATRHKATIDFESSAKGTKIYVEFKF
jgi:PAS domain S-box-containing protein